jgi:D-sedoheptulose 7-phosphate isomerase
VTGHPVTMSFPLLTTTALDDLISTLQTFRRLTPLLDSAAAAIVTALEKGNKILTCGNGGSAADALHMAEELVGRYRTNRRALPAIALCADPTALTCIANDFGFEHVFSRQLEALGEKGDVLVIFSTSGNSPNLALAVEAAARRGVTTVALLGKTGGLLTGKCDHEIIVPSNDTARIQEVHTFVMHAWLEQVEAAFTSVPEAATV